MARLRFRRRSYQGATSSPPRWHIAEYNYQRGEVYLRYEAICGYTIQRGLFANVMLSSAVRPKGLLCAKCERKADSA